MKNSISLLILLFSVMFVACQQKNKFKSVSPYGQFAPPDAFRGNSKFAYYGAENEWTRRMFSEKAANTFYKRRGQRELLAILDDHPEEAVKLCTKSIKEDDTDLESMFVLTLAFAKMNQPEKAYQTAITAVNKGLPFGRFLAGPRDLLKPLYQYGKFKKLMKSKNIKLIHGPLLGSVTDKSARLWFRTVDESVVKIKIFDNKNGDNLITTAEGKSSAKKDYTVVVQLSKLKPDTRYYYDVFIDGQRVREKMSFITFPQKGSKEKIKIAFGGGGGYTPAHEKIWKVISDYKPDALLLLGDNVYIDLPQMPGDFHKYTYYRRQSRPEFRNLVAHVPTFTIWDDHDAAIDDVWMGPYLNKPKWKLPMLKFFEMNWNNPAQGTEKTPGVFYKFSIGNVDFFMLDCRFYRTNPFKEETSMLGPAQKKWLKNSLLKSTGIFKFIISSVPWNFRAKPGSKDTWAGFAKERKELFDYIDDNKIEGIILISADRHRSDAWKIKRENGYDFYEFTSSKLTNIHTHELMPGALFGYNAQCSFGLLDINTASDNPETTFKIVSIDGTVKDSLSVFHSELTFTK